MGWMNPCCLFSNGALTMFGYGLIVALRLLLA
jgi:hypothetical protein